MVWAGSVYVVIVGDKEREETLQACAKRGVGVEAHKYDA